MLCFHQPCLYVLCPWLLCCFALTAGRAEAARERALPCRPKVSVRVVRVVDGDTVIARFRGKTLRVRLLGLDAPELRDHRPAVRAIARQARDRLRAWLGAAGGEAELRTARRRTAKGRYRCFFVDVYERTLARLFVDVEGRLRDVGQRLVREGLACDRRVKRGCDPR